MYTRSVSSTTARIHAIGRSNSTYNVTATNKKGPIAAQSVDLFSWGIHVDEPTIKIPSNVRAVGVRSESNSPLGLGSVSDPLITFAINTHERWSSPTGLGFKIYIDVDPQNKNGDDYYVFAIDFGYTFRDVDNGRIDTVVYSNRDPEKFDYLNSYYYAPSGLQTLTIAPTDSSVVLLPILSSFLCLDGEYCLNSTNPRFTYRIESWNMSSRKYEPCPGMGYFNAYTPSLTLQFLWNGPSECRGIS